MNVQVLRDIKAQKMVIFAQLTGIADLCSTHLTAKTSHHCPDFLAPRLRKCWQAVNLIPSCTLP